MKKYANELKVKDILEKETYAVVEVKIHKTRNNEPFYNIRLGDKSGDIVARIWSNRIANCEVDGLRRGDIVNIWGEVQEFQEKPQLVINSLVVAETYDLSELMKVSERNIDAMWEDLNKIMDGIENKYLKELLDNVFSDEDIVAKFRSSPAALMVHHGFVGGLLEHTLEMLSFAKPYKDFYPEADFDLITTGIILHDIGKIFEMKQMGTVYEFGVEGALIGHINQGIEFITTKKPEKMPRKLWVHLIHIIISHHGEYADIKPVTIEAAIVSVVDFGSSRVRQYQQHMKEGIDKPENISDYSKYLDSRVYIGDRDWEIDWE